MGLPAQVMHRAPGLISGACGSHLASFLSFLFFLSQAGAVRMFCPGDCHTSVRAGSQRQVTRRAFGRPEAYTGGGRVRTRTGRHSRRHRVRIPGRPPRGTWAPDLLSVDIVKLAHRKDGAAGDWTAPAVIWSSGVWAPIRLMRQESAGSIPACSASAKAGSGAPAGQQCSPGGYIGTRP